MNFFSFNFHQLREAGTFAASPTEEANEKDIKMIEGCLRPGNSLPSLWSTTFNLHLEGDPSFRLYLTPRPSPAALALLGNMYMYRRQRFETNPNKSNQTCKHDNERNPLQSRNVPGSRV